MLDLQSRVSDAFAAQANEFGGALHLTRKAIDVDVVTLEFDQDSFQFGECFGIAE
jgi:hypothetical protein